MPSPTSPHISAPVPDVTTRTCSQLNNAAICFSQMSACPPFAAPVTEQLTGTDNRRYSVNFFLSNFVHINSPMMIVYFFIYFCYFEQGVCRIRFEKCFGDFGASAAFQSLRILEYSASLCAATSAPNLPCFFEALASSGNQIRHTHTSGFALKAPPDINSYIPTSVLTA